MVDLQFTGLVLRESHSYPGPRALVTGMCLNEMVLNHIKWGPCELELMRFGMLAAVPRVLLEARLHHLTTDVQELSDSCP